MSRATIQFSGNITADPELRFTPNGDAVASFSVAVNERKRGANGEWVDAGASFYRCSAWRRLGENVANELHRGDRVVVVGTMAQRAYEKDGKTVTTFDVTVDDVGKSLMFASDGAPAPKPAPSRASAPADDDPPF